ncbi:uncharacterized protein LOC142612425 [Castanea sativa]|uniref:uncharacterized protein LOC142612425 n=1 Tax=Castanea sativa TaxID=21020 RepID=UPI003F65360B
MFNEIDGNFDNVAIKTFKVGLPAEHGLRKSLTGKLVESVRQLMDHIDKYKRVKEDQQKGKGKAKVAPQDRRDFRSNQYNYNHPLRDFSGQSASTTAQVVNPVFRKPGSHAGSGVQENTSARSPLGTIGVILVAPRKTASQPSRVMSVAWPSTGDLPLNSKRVRSRGRLALNFSNEDKIGTLQPHDDALVATLRIEGYDIKRVLVDQGSSVKIMYPDLYKRLKLRPEDLASYDSPLI